MTIGAGMALVDGARLKGTSAEGSAPSAKSWKHGSASSALALALVLSLALALLLPLALLLVSIVRLDRYGSGALAKGFLVLLGPAFVVRKRDCCGRSCMSKGSDG